MIPSITAGLTGTLAVYQRGWMIDSQHLGNGYGSSLSISKGIDD